MTDDKHQDINRCLDAMHEVIASMKQTNTNMIPLRQVILARWREILWVHLEELRHLVGIPLEVEVSKEEVPPAEVFVGKDYMPKRVVRLKIKKKTKKG